MKIKPLTDKSGEVRELTKEDMKRFRPADEVLSPQLWQHCRKESRGSGGLRRSRRRNPSQFVTAAMPWSIFELPGPAGKRVLMTR
jgi:hypothetical protein